MSITEERPAVAVPMPAKDTWRRWDRVVGRLLVVGWLCAAFLLLAVGEREGSYARLANDLRAGDVDQVEVVGAMEPDGAGQVEAVVRWRDGLITRTATVIQTADERSARRARREPMQPPVIVGSITDDLVALDPDVRIVEGQRWGPSSTVYGWGVPGGVGLPLLVLFVGTLGLIGGPQPWRATRWAWAWLVLLAPAVGIPAYLLLGGPLGVGRPKTFARLWLTGGWAFLLALLLGGAAASR